MIPTKLYGILWTDRLDPKYSGILGENNSSVEKRNWINNSTAFIPFTSLEKAEARAAEIQVRQSTQIIVWKVQCTCGEDDRSPTDVPLPHKTYCAVYDD